jgi:2-amino-4-hydroxy-6-hydroxymethyldihydropteridine diphosphokinase
VEETAPLGDVPQGPYLNQMILLETTLAPAELLGHCLAIEAERGRVRRPGERWGPRTLDLDIVQFGALAVHEPGGRLTIPHPELPHRAFWQREIAQIEALVVTHGR